jgi:cytochrome b561
MPMRNGSHGYGLVTKFLHWLTVGAIAAQFPIGYQLHHGGGRASDDGSFANGWTLQDLHVAMGMTILALALARTLWRVTTTLPPWAEFLSPVERRVESILEKVLLALLLLVPATGLLFVVADAPFALHVSTQVAFLAALAVHVGLVLRHTFVRRDRILSRML